MSHANLDYEPLDASLSQIRVLTLQSGLRDAPIECALSVVSLDDAPIYNALSYVWGDATKTTPIEVDGQQFGATLNLHQALRHLRSADESVVLWVDAVCINQRDAQEKSFQIALMGRVYQQCDQVWIWLGCRGAMCALDDGIKRVGVDKSAVESRNPFELMMRLAEDRHFLDLPCFSRDSTSDSVVFEETLQFQEQWADFVMIMQLKWWTRMWTVQEVILPKTGTLIFDTWTVSLDDVTRLGSQYYEHAWKCCDGIIDLLPDPWATTLDELCTVLYTLDVSRNSLEEDEYFDIHEQHLTCSTRECYDRRDKLYGLLALVGNTSDVEPWLEPDYSHSEREVFYDGTLAMLYRDLRSLRCLTGMHHGPESRQWASWVRNFGACLSQTEADVEQTRLMIYNLFDASHGKTWWPSVYQAFPRMADELDFQVALRVQGVRIGKLGVIGSAMPYTVSGDEAQQKETYKEWLLLANTSYEAQSPAQAHSMETVRTWRTILYSTASQGKSTQGRFDIRRFQSSTDMAWYDEFQAWLASAQSEHNLDFALARTLLLATYGRCYYRTTSGGQGLCYPNARPGDEIWALRSSKVPFVLRPADVPEHVAAELHPTDAYAVLESGEYGLRSDYEGEEIFGHYELVGDCYCDGYMDGEAFVAADVCERTILLV